ncbi:MAG TPA: transaldolase family protein, partial [Bryocella sp.]|nr:transaldolase family protein [Bryocella sp.]
MKPTQHLHDLGQSLWLDNITRTILDNGTLKRYINELSVTGLTSNPTIFDHAMTKGDAYNDDMGRLMSSGMSTEDAFFEMA